jgi:uncharacterized protein (TIGR03435 family)
MSIEALALLGCLQDIYLPEKTHREAQKIPMYALIVGKNGPKMKPVGADAAGGAFVHPGDQGNNMETSKWNHGTIDGPALIYWFSHVNRRDGNDP